MARLEIKYITKSNRYNPHERILGVGGTNSPGSRWYLTQKAAIKAIDDGEHEFFVRVDGKEVDVIVAESRFGNLYLKTKADGEQPNNLLSLPECP